jgi:hypothetical protein
VEYVGLALRVSFRLSSPGSNSDDDAARAVLTAILGAARPGGHAELVGMAKRKATSRSRPPAPLPRVDQPLGDLREMIEAARARVASMANTELTLLYWRIGRKIHAEILSGERAPNGEAILATLSQQLAAEYGRGERGRS